MPRFYGLLEVSPDGNYLAVGGEEGTYILDGNMQIKKIIGCPELNGQHKKTRFADDSRFILVGGAFDVIIYDMFDTVERPITVITFPRKYGGLSDFRMIDHKLFIIFGEQLIVYKIMSFFPFIKHEVEKLNEKVYWCADGYQYLYFKGDTIAVTNILTNHIKMVNFSYPILKHTLTCYGGLFAYFTDDKNCAIADLSESPGSILARLTGHTFNLRFTRYGNVIINMIEGVFVYNLASKKTETLKEGMPSIMSIEEFNGRFVALSPEYKIVIIEP